MSTRKVMVITGGAGSIGSCVSRRMVEEGFVTVILEQRLEEAEALVAELNESGKEAVAIRCDTADEESVSQAFDRVMEDYGRIDVLVYNAGVECGHGWMETPFQEWKRMFAVNCDGMFLCVQRAAREMTAAGIRGKMILTLGLAAYAQSADAVLYHATQWCGRGFMRNAAMALAPYGITVNGICPGTVWNEELEGQLVRSGKTKEEFLNLIAEPYPLGRIQTGEDVAAMCAFLVREGHSITGQSLLVAGGAAFS